MYRFCVFILTYVHVHTNCKYLVCEASTRFCAAQKWSSVRSATTLSMPSGAASTSHEQNLWLQVRAREHDVWHPAEKEIHRLQADRAHRYLNISTFELTLISLVFGISFELPIATIGDNQRSGHLNLKSKSLLIQIQDLKGVQWPTVYDNWGSTPTTNPPFKKQTVERFSKKTIFVWPFQKKWLKKKKQRCAFNRTEPAMTEPSGPYSGVKHVNCSFPMAFLKEMYHP